ncbi:MAG: YbdD/YjiX family protein [Mycobacterium sp.]|nr:YbdD/YjiX family protein [Mycobacterium sp.]
MGRFGGFVTGLTRQIRWYVGALMGDSHYQRYAAHRRRTHPGEPVISEADYWRLRHREADANPGARCC